jgi:hypothetical protein
MTERRGDEQAFPNRPGLVGGVPIREYLAAKAMAAIIAAGWDDVPKSIAKLAFEMADAMIEAAGRKAGE